MSWLRRTLTTSGLSLLLVLSIATTALWAAVRFAVAPLDIDDDVYTVLVLGSDAGPPRPGSVLSGRADGIHIVSIVPEDRRISILSFPRDTWADIPGYGSSKVNAALTLGPDVMVEAMQDLTGIAIDDWIVAGFNGMVSAIDELGGVTIDVERRLNDPNGAYSDLQPGVQVLDGTQALSYVRDRKSRPDGDFGRSESHARMLQALHAQLAAEGPSLDRVAAIVSLLARHSATSISPARLFQLAAVTYTVDPADVERVRVDARIGNVGAASVVFLTEKAEEQIADVREDGVFGER